MTHKPVFLRRALRPLALLAVVLVVITTAGCGTSRTDAAAAKVDDAAIKVGDLEGVLKAVAKSDSTFKGTGKGTYPAVATADILSYLIQHELLLEAAEAKGVKVTAAQRTSGRTNANTIFGRGDAAKGKPLFDSFPKAVQTRVVEAEASLLALQAEFGKGTDTEALARAEYKKHPEQYQTACLNGIVTDSQEAADDVQVRLGKGEKFADVSKSASTDKALAAKDGDIGCEALSNISDPDLAAKIAKAKPNEVLETIPAAPNYIVLQVRELKTQPFEEVSDQIVKTLPVAGGAELQAFLNKRAKSRHVTVNPRYGHWDAKKATVVPPKEPKGLTTTTTAPAAGASPEDPAAGATTAPGS